MGMRRLWALAIVGMLVIAACGGDETPAGRSGSVPSLSEKIEEFRSVLAEEFPDLNTRGTPFTNLVFMVAALLCASMWGVAGYIVHAINQRNESR